VSREDRQEYPLKSSLKFTATVHRAAQFRPVIGPMGSVALSIGRRLVSIPETFFASGPCSNDMIARYAFIGIWSAACLWILWSSLAAPPPIDVKDIHVGMTFWMTVLSLPSGLLVFVASNFIASFFGSYFSLAWKYHPAFFYFIWSCYFGVGLVQWVLLLFWPRRARRSTQLTG
jgi:hypothetical protein